MSKHSARAEELNALEGDLFRATEQVRGSLSKMEHSLRNDGEIPERYVDECRERIGHLRRVMVRLDGVVS